MFQAPGGGFGSFRDRTGFFVRRKNPIATLVAFFISLAILVILLVPIVVIGIVVIVLMIIRRLIGFIFGALRSTTRPNGVLDGRRNVRVRVSSDNESV